MYDKLNACRSGGTPLVPWVASKAATPGVLASPAAGKCYASLVFDINTTVTGTPANPTTIYVEGDITVGPGIKVNAASATPSAPSLLIYSVGPRVAFDGSGATGPTLGAGLWAPLAECATNSALRPVSIYGAIACTRLGNGGAWKFYYDDVFAVNAATLGGPKVWNLVQIDGGKW
jgi:hypothetical protein